jgi:hypothetical protein
MVRRGAVLEAAPETGCELEIDAELFDEPFDALALLASIEASLDDVEPWQRLSDVLGRITGEAETD